MHYIFKRFPVFNCVNHVSNHCRFTGLDIGIIININDICAWHSLGCNRPDLSSSYLTSKTALRNLTDNLRVELARINSNVKVVVSFSFQIA